MADNDGVEITTSRQEYCLQIYRSTVVAFSTAHRRTSGAKFSVTVNDFGNVSRVLEYVVI